MTYFTIYGNFTKLHGDAHMHKLRGNGRPAPQSKESREGFKKKGKIGILAETPLVPPPKKTWVLCYCFIQIYTPQNMGKIIG